MKSAVPTTGNRLKICAETERFAKAFARIIDPRTPCSFRMQRNLKIALPTWHRLKAWGLREVPRVY